MTSRNEEIAPDLLDAETDYRTTGNNRRTRVRLLKIVRVKKVNWDSRSGARLFSDRAGVSVKLKLYSLAMKCYYKAEQYKSRAQLPWHQLPLFTGTDAADVDTDNVNPLSDSSFYDSPPYTAKSEPVKTSDIWESFDDGKAAVSYALIVHAKQPISGKRKSFTHINNVGHMFITLIKYNEDNTFVSRSFGFYPHKTSILSGTPFHANAPSVFKDGALRDWNQIASKFSSVRRFQKLIGYFKRYDDLTSNLNLINSTNSDL